MERILCGVDLGGTKLSVGLVEETGRVLQIDTVYDHRNKTPDEIVDLIAALVQAQCERMHIRVAELGGIGMGSAGHLRHRDGVMITMSNLKGFQGYPIRQRLQARFPVKVSVDNDANAQAYAEYRFGLGKGLDPFLFLTVSTQIGAGIVLGGRIFRGLTGTAGEFGHTIVNAESTEVCPCGNRGCLIAHASGVAIPSAFRRQLSEGKPSVLAQREPSQAEQPDGAFILKGLSLGDAACQGVVDEFAEYLGIGMYNLFQTFNPAVIVVGGGMTNWGDALFAPMRRKFESLAAAMMFDKMEILPGRVENSGVVGAALLGMA
jgi:glucokinase